jgi:hypothetical protein
LLGWIDNVLGWKISNQTHHSTEVLLSVSQIEDSSGMSRVIRIQPTVHVHALLAFMTNIVNFGTTFFFDKCVKRNVLCTYIL